MNMQFRKPDVPLMVCTDLDGTLLDHDSYSFAPAGPALDRLAGLGVPVIPVSSKTLAELAELNRALRLQGPCIAENGGLIAVPRGYFAPDPRWRSYQDFEVQLLSPDYADIVRTLAEVRRERGFDFAGFADLPAAEVSALTGLTAPQAELARRRLCSEPIVWRDGEPAFEAFRKELELHGLGLIKGGRFHHVLGRATDKARAIDKLAARYADSGFHNFTRIALGDSPNDEPMLRNADIAVVIRRKDGSHLDVRTDARRVLTHASGPGGWNEFFQQYLDTLAAGATATGHRNTHG
jgi:mannosyl-3-phosphoglycerate phosphatase